MSAADHLRRLPKVDRVLEHPALTELGLRRRVVRRVVVERIADERERVRAALERGRDPGAVADLEAIASAARARLDAWLDPHPAPVLNGTGVLLHTNLGRAPLSAAAREAALAASGYCDLEFELETGKRGSRLAHLRPLLAALFEAEDALVVNNGAAALLLACTALGAPGGVALSRGQHVEIGDGFRVADMAAAGGVPVIPVGSTNRTHLRDYEAALGRTPGRALGRTPGRALGRTPGRAVGRTSERALGRTSERALGRTSERASALLWVHRSNFEQRGFVAEVELAKLAKLAKDRAVPLIADLGSGLVDPGVVDAERGAGEPTVSAYLEQGATIVGFSGDKLLGGPQAGLLVGSAAAVAACRRHPLARALRCGKLALAALHATARAHLHDPQRRPQPGAATFPVHAMLSVGVDTLRARAERLCATLSWPRSCVRASRATVGGGSLPGRELASVALVPRHRSAHDAAEALRRARPPLIARIVADELWIDLRTLIGVDDAALLEALRVLG